MKKIFKLSLLAILITIYSCSDAPKKNFKINPPFEKTLVKDTLIEINPTKSQVLRFGNSLTVDIPKDAFVDKNGNIVKDKVKLSIKTYDNPAAIIASGIPMQYGEEHLQSAGMFEMEGQANGEPISISKDKQLLVNHHSDVYGEYDFYKFDKDATDEKSGRWNQLTDKSTPIYKEKDVLKTFKLKFKTEDYPELSDLANIDWKLALPYFDPTQAPHQWVSEEPWGALSITKPKYGLQKYLASVPYNNFLVYDEAKTIITIDSSQVDFWSFEGEHLKTITGKHKNLKSLNSRYNRFNYFLVDQSDFMYFYTLDGTLKGKGIKGEYNPQLLNDKDCLVFRTWSREFKEDTIYIGNLKGEIIKTIILEEDNNYTTGQLRVYTNFVATKNSDIAVLDAKGIYIYNSKGELLKERKGKFSQLGQCDDNEVLIHHLDGRLEVWDYKTDLKILSPAKDFHLGKKRVDGYLHSASCQKLKGHPIICINLAGDYNNTKLWNYKTNTTTSLAYYMPDYYYEQRNNPNFLAGRESKKEDYYIYSVKSKKTIIDLDKICWWGEVIQEPVVSEDEQHLLINCPEQQKLFSASGDLVSDFRAFDSLINSSGFVSNDTVWTMSKDGIFRLWSTTGQLLSSQSLGYPDILRGYSYYSKSNKQNIDIYGSIFRNSYLLNVQGQLLLDYGRSWGSSSLSFNACWKTVGKLRKLAQTTELPPNVYQLNLHTKDKEFTTYIYLSEADLEIINRYNASRMKKANEELDRQEQEIKVLRQFAIQDFGIYNWDKVYKNENRIQLAADFDFGQTVDYNNITVFLITELNGRAIIKYYEGSWNKFTFDPTVPNQLLAVLPKNKIAVFTEEDFKALDIDKIKTSKAYTFHLKTKDKPINTLQDLEKSLAQN
ncbi:MAG: hypothetical protein GY810_29260 [Aureispira sp.]|nr:hypothetical protein [Aureispira sp.]